MGGSVRLRYETLTGQPRINLPPTDQQVALRTTLAVEYKATPTFRIGAEMFDSRAWLGKPGSSVSANDVNTLEVVQGYVAVDLTPAQGTKLTLEAGRFVLNLGSRRLIAADDYRNTTNGYTGLRADLKTSDGTAATLIYTLPQIRKPDDQASVLANRYGLDKESFDLRLWGGLVWRPKTVFGATAEASYFRLQERDSPSRATRDRNLHTVAARLIREPKAGKPDFEIEGAWQFGEVSETARTGARKLDVDAWFIHADAGYLFPGPAHLRLSVEYDYASGDGPGGSYGRFDTLFGMRRADFSPAGVLAAIGRSNIKSPGLRAEVAPGKRFDAFATYHPLWLAERTDSFATTGVRDASGKSGTFAGHQIEGRMRYWIVPGFLRGEVNAFWLAKGRFLRAAPNAPATGNTTYVSSAVLASF
ncbi:alginate export family protein [Novosphingobium sp. 1Y9A]|uniref:Alginate export family protein n=1 Tax=Novosphingobium jiangmenense TaxID=2791981 RepID=A0ABS0HHB7_9SPHN|nr:alginate export family protein [Novosphingobium jiangmenense]